MCWVSASKRTLANVLKRPKTAAEQIRQSTRGFFGFAVETYLDWPKARLAENGIASGASGSRRTQGMNLRLILMK